jgi:AcrR family transcriptional regulator
MDWHVRNCHREYDEVMGRWEPDARGRLQKAALDLFIEHGYEQTTVTEIASRAGLTERTFFRHFADKREVLSAGARELQDGLVTAVAAVPGSVAPVDTVAAALRAVAPVIALPERREYARRRHSVIAANAELQERELLKLAALVAAIADALRLRGVPDPAAVLAAEAGIAVFKIAFGRWISEPGEPDFAPLIEESLQQLRSVTAGE